MNIKMNAAAGRKLYEICQPYTNFFEHGMDFGDFIETVGISLDDLNQYFNGQKDLRPDHLHQIARTCEMNAEYLEHLLTTAYTEWIAEQEAERKRKQAYQQKKERLEKLNALERTILEDLAPYDIKRIERELRHYPLEDYYPLKFIMYYLKNQEMLPLLKERLAATSDEELVYKDSNALMWAADSRLSYEILLLLAERKDFIAKHICDQRADGQTALHLFVNAQYANPEGIDLLVSWGADVNAKDNYLWTPLHDAEACQCDALVNRLYQLGAVSSVNKDGKTPADIRFRLDALDAW